MHGGSYSRMETPHYHRRFGVSLLSSAWGQVGPPLVPPGKFFVLCPVSFTLIRRWLLLRASVTYFCMLLPSLRFAALSQRKSFRTESELKIVVFSTRKHLRR